jgi:hypothetical protein
MFTKSQAIVPKRLVYSGKRGVSSWTVLWRNKPLLVRIQPHWTEMEQEEEEEEEEEADKMAPIVDSDTNGI